MKTQQQEGRTGWIAIPSVPPERAAQAFAAFYSTIAAAIAIDILLITYNHRPATWQLTAEMVFDDGGQIMAWALAATWPIMEAMRMVIARIMEKQTYLKGHAQGMAEGRELGRELGKEETNRVWADWNRRRLRAETRGEPFTEPSPDEDDKGTA